MRKILRTRSELEVIKLGDEWAKLMEEGNYTAAFEFTSHDKNGWSSDSLGEVIKAYGDSLPTQKVTVHGVPTDVSQRKEVTWYNNDPERIDIGELWYDVNIDGKCTDLTATFDIMDDGQHVYLQLRDIHVM